MVFDTPPSSWQELQLYVGRMFSECGFLTEVSKVVDLVRGKKEIDVYAKDLESEYQSEILVECKFWNSPVTQEVVHSFRSVIADYGANIGFIVSKIGFQSGCLEAVRKTNIKLVTFEDIERVYFDKWKTSMSRKYRRYSDELFPYWDYPGKRVIDGGKIDFTKQQLIHDAYEPICSLGPMDDLKKEFRRSFPITIPVIDDSLQITGEYTINSYRQYFDFIEANKEKAIKHYKILYREY